MLKTTLSLSKQSFSASFFLPVPTEKKVKKSYIQKGSRYSFTEKKNDNRS